MNGVYNAFTEINIITIITIVNRGYTYLAEIMSRLDGRRVATEFYTLNPYPLPYFFCPCIIMKPVIQA